MEGKEKSITKLLRLSSAPSVLMVRCPEPSVEVEIGPEQAFAGRDDGPCVGTYTGGGGEYLLFCACMSAIVMVFFVCVLNQLSDRAHLHH